MPRPSKGPRLALFKAKGRATVWNIRDGQRTIGTGCAEGDRETAERKLGEYITRKHDPRASRSSGDPNQVKIADALSVYLTDRTSPVLLDKKTGKPLIDKKTGKPIPNPDLVARPKALIKMSLTLGEFFSERNIGELNGELQRDYAQQRGSQSAARRDLETLAAAINHHTRDMIGGVQTLFRPVLPDAMPARERWLTRDEAARLIWAAWRKREMRGGTEKGRHTSRHIARFILVGLYTGTRAGAICSASLMPTIGRGHVNLETGQFRRLAYGKQETNKKRPTVDLPPRLLAHIRRWNRLGISRQAVVEWQGKPVGRVSNGWNAVVEAAGLATDVKQERVIPHTLRHTSISWYLRSAVPIDQVSTYCGVSIQIIKKHYGHHLPGRDDGILRASTRIGRGATAMQQKPLQRT
jgi:integrase